MTNVNTRANTPLETAVTVHDNIVLLVGDLRVTGFEKAIQDGEQTVAGPHVAGYVSGAPPAPSFTEAGFRICRSNARRSPTTNRPQNR
ncbi:MAG: hypothetical protein JJU29_09570 [Verrucomicrobia bacterium]|nr:hypothetical protein [Verrucomicrobiota bacterium]